MIMLKNFHHDEHPFQNQVKVLKKGIRQKITENGKMTTTTNVKNGT